MPMGICAVLLPFSGDGKQATLVKPFPFLLKSTSVASTCTLHFKVANVVEDIGTVKIKHFEDIACVLSRITKKRRWRQLEDVFEQLGSSRKASKPELKLRLPTFETLMLSIGCQANGHESNSKQISTRVEHLQLKNIQAKTSAHELLDEDSGTNQDDVVEASSRVAARRKVKEEIRESKAEITDTIAHETSADAQSCNLLRHGLKHIVFGTVLNLAQISFLSLDQLNHMFDQIAKGGNFRWFAGRSILDFKINGEQTIALKQPYSVLQPLVATMIALASRTMEENEELAIIQLIINYFKDGSDVVKPHTHRCRQVCVALGSARELEVEGRHIVMSHGDILPLNQTQHSVPPARHARLSSPRISVCMFYGSVDEFQNKAISVNANDGLFGESYWFNHPKDMTESKGQSKGKSSGKGSGGVARRSALGHRIGRSMDKGKRG